MRVADSTNQLFGKKKKKPKKKKINGRFGEKENNSIHSLKFFPDSISNNRYCHLSAEAEALFIIFDTKSLRLWS